MFARAFSILFLPSWQILKVLITIFRLNLLSYTHLFFFFQINLCSKILINFGCYQNWLPTTTDCLWVSRIFQTDTGSWFLRTTDRFSLCLTFCQPNTSTSLCYRFDFRRIVYVHACRVNIFLYRIQRRRHSTQRYRVYNKETMINYSILFKTKLIRIIDSKSCKSCKCVTQKIVFIDM